MTLNSTAAQTEREEEEELDETPQEKKLRLAKLYLEQLREEGRCPCLDTCKIIL